MKKIAGAVILMAGLYWGIVYWALAQPAPRPLAELFPAGALLYVEAKDFGALLSDWNGSAEKKAWLESANYQAFSRSRVLIKLGDAQNEFAAAAGVPPDYAMLGSVAGRNSALAMYGIGKLEFLYITRLASARAMDSALWKSRGTYQTRKAGGADYYVKEDKATQRVAAFAYTGDVLLLATKEELIAGALELIARQTRPSLVAEKWFADSVQAAAPGSNDVRMVYNLARLTPAAHFRSYWVQRNGTELREFAAGLADLERTSGELRERRVLLRSNPGAALSDEAAVGQVLASVPDEAGLYRAWLRPDADRAEHWIREKLFAATALPVAENKRAPGVSNTAEAGGEQDLETRIDEPPLTGDRTAVAFAPLRDTPIEAMLDVQSTRIAADQVYVRPQSAMVLIGRDAWDANAMRAALSAAASRLWGAGDVALAIDGKWLIVGDSANLVNAIVARKNRPAVAGAVYAAGWRHARELPNFERMTRLIDFPRIPPAADGAEEAREPMFFSENIASLGRTLQRVQSANIAVHDSGAMLREAVVYRFAP